MRLHVNGRNIEITQPIKDYVKEKFARVTKHYDQVMEMDVILHVNKNPSVSKNHIAEVICKVKGERIHVKEEAESMYASIDLLADKLDRQVKKHKEKLLKSKGKTTSIRTEDYEEPEEGEVESETEEEPIVDIEVQ